MQKVVDMEETYKDGYALYYLAQAYRKNNDLETAKDLLSEDRRTVSGYRARGECTELHQY